MRKIILATLMLFSTSLIFSQLTHYDWSTGQGEAVLSDKYQVFVKHGSDPEEEVEVLMSEADPNDIQYDFKRVELTGRTFSYASIAYNKATGSGLTFRIVKKFGNISNSAEIVPKSYNISPSISNGEVSFSLNDNNKFISVNFKDSENETANDKWIKHMLTIFVDPPETDVPNLNSPSVVTYSNSRLPSTLQSAGTIYFPPGYYNLKDYQFNSSIINSEGELTLQNGQDIYIAGGAFVDGLVLRQGFNNTGQKIYGRGVLSGRLFPWQDGQGNKPYRQIIEMGKFAEINGVHVVDSPNHGIVSPNNMTITNLKFLGWHANNDAIRVGQDSEIKNSFIRAVDDFFYNFDNYVHDCILWAGHNGAVITYGWGGDPGGNTYNSGASTLENIDVINPEWTGLGNNNGLVASQTGLDYKPFAYNNSSTLTTLKNIRIEGTIPGLLNLKPRSNGGTPNAVKVTQANLGYLGDLLLKDITVEGQSGKSRIRGQRNATTTGNSTFFVQNVTITNTTIGGTEVNDISAPVFFDIEASTTQNIVFDIGTGSSSSDLEIEDFKDINVTEMTANISGQNYRGITQTDIQAIPVGTGQWFASSQGSSKHFDTQNTGGNPEEYLSRVSENEFAQGVVYIFNNTEGDAFGILNMSFDYFWKSPLTNDRISFRCWGINDDEANGIDGTFRLSGGAGAFGDNDATNYITGSDGTDLGSNLALGVSETWQNVAFTIDVTQYEYIAISFAGAFQSTRTNPETLFGIDNVTVPKNKVLSIDSFNKNVINVFPNPVNDILTINKIDNIKQYTIFDVTGKQLIKSTKEISRTIDLSNLKRGIYFLEVLTRKNSKTIVKILKE